MNALLGPDNISDVLMAVQSVIGSVGNRGLLIGGVAVSLLAKPRYTADVDALLLYDIADLAELLAQAALAGLEPRTADPIAFAEETRVLPLQHTATQINVDISLGVLPFEQEAVERATLFQTDTFAVRLPTVEDLIILKAIAHRPKDLADVQSLLDAHPNRDDARIEHWIREFADALEAPELWEDIAVLMQAT